MKYPKFLAAVLAACLFAAAAFAAEASPAGTWTWQQPGRGDGPATERSVVLEFKDGKVTGTVKGWRMGEVDVPDRTIGDASFKEGKIAFSTTIEFNGTTYVTKYAGKLEGDSIKGSIERQGRDGAITKNDWTAKRAATK